MGIQGLLPLLKSIMNPIHIKELEGCTVAVDAYSWLHKGAFSCSTELCKGQPTAKHIDYCMHRVNMMRHYGVTPILVFDGGPLPMKTDQEIKRARSRRENLSRAMQHESNGNLSAAYESYQKAVDISPSVAYDLIQVLKQENVSHIVAPYEADAQMAFLALRKHVDAVITEDSDLIAFGCPRIIYKMDKFGQGVEFRNAMLQHNKDLNLTGFTQMMLLEMCILSGCDYLQSLPGVGLKKAHTLMKKFKRHENVIKHLKYNSVEPTGIVDEDLDFLGPSLPQHVAKGIARGDLDPFTKEPIQRESRVTEKVLHATYQLKNLKPDGERKKIDLPVQKNLLTNYFCFASLEAKRKFSAPRIIPNESNATSSPCINVHEVIRGSKIDDQKFLDAQDHGPSEREAVRYTEMKPFSLLQTAVCKPCNSSHKDLDSPQGNGKTTSVNKNGIVRSTYFLKKSRENNGKKNEIDVDKNGDNKLENVVSGYAPEPLSALLEETCRKVETRVAVQSSYCRLNLKHNTRGERENVLGKYSDQTQMFGLDAGDCKITIDNRKHRVMSSYFEEISVNENNEVPESEKLKLAVRGVADESCNHSSLGSPTRNNTLECTKKRKIAQTDSPREYAKENIWMSGVCTSDVEEETKPPEGKFGCNIGHLGRYSDIAEKSMERFVSVISSFRYNSSGSRASGLRPPLKDIKNNCLKKTMPSRYHKA